ncbi:hypothetical protein BZG35_05805 [Brevundimonas sp. LM2]|uniref:hypothetical protein n=1 Tax=Brevundimonas sp. LM2 TaxID=1938605 RepID=UPI000983E2B2|nr:hypothetical protein [Brevundimonas sp. LM2]AQR61216.1 hypothetical protein BZG35_05805 [Brevundimonas sp. LM2]
MFKFLLPATAALGLVAFTAQSQDVASAETAAAATPVMQWSVHHEGALAKLAYGVAHSDQLALMVSCLPGDRTAAVYGDVQPEGARLIRASLPQGVDPLSDGEAEETRIALSDPSLQGLARRGRMAVRGDAGVFQLSATVQERRAIADFLAYCSAGRV